MDRTNLQLQKGLVSVGMATRNRGPLIREAVDSILNQTYKNLELIISDNVSDDATREICEEYAKKDRRVRYIRQERDIGSWANCNFTIKEARGEFFMRADDDDFRDPTVIEHAVEVLNAHPDVILVFGEFYTLDPASGKRIDYHSANYLPLEQGRYERVKRYISFYVSDGKNLLLHGLWRRRVLEGGMSRAFYFGWDVNFVLEKLIEGPFGYIPEVIFRKGARIESEAHATPSRILRSFVNRVKKIFSRFFYVNIGIIVRSRDLTLWEKIRLVCVQLFVMARLFFARRT